MTITVFDLASKRISTKDAPVAATAVHADLLTDTLYLVDDTDIVPVIGGATAVAVWRSKKFVVPSITGFGWARVNAQFISGVVLRLYTDGVLYYTTPFILTRDPVRLPPGLGRKWEIEIESADRTTTVTLATTVGELL